MSEPGHIYVMINPSIEGLVKIGKTTRDPESRAKELSQATGVATPFYVAYSIEVEDCHSAEEYVHAVLEHKGFKRSPNREFFEMPLRDAIEVLILADEELQRHAGTGQENAQVPSWDSQDYPSDDLLFRHPGAAVLWKAYCLYHGLGDEIKDRKEALRLLHQAKSLNYAPAYTASADYFIRAAEQLHLEGNTVGSRELREKALEVLKEGAQKGHGRCFVKMTELYDGHGSEFSHENAAPEDASKCWKKYFRSATFVNDDDRKWDCDLTWENECGRSRVDYARQYLDEVFGGFIPLDPEIRQILLPRRAEIVGAIKGSIQYITEKGIPNAGDREALDICSRFLKFVESAL